MTYVFHSTLSPELIRIRLQMRTKPMRGISWSLEENQTFSRLLPPDRFYLVCTGGAWQARPQTPFVGRIQPEGKGSRITGSFRPAAATRNGLLVMMVLALVAGLAVSGGDMSALPLLAAVILLWGGLCWLFWSRFSPMLTKKYNCAAIAFIEENLLCE